jgi:SAM-dependent methyltransferase
MLAQLYHAHHSLHPEDLPFWQTLAAQQGGPILELGCGTGRVLLPLTQQGFQVVGLDSDLAMLACLRAQTDGLTPPIFQADMSAFHLGRLFSLILLPCNTFSTLTFAQRQGTLACAHRHLQREGVFAISLPNPTLLAELPKRGDMEMEDVFPHPVDGEPVEASSAWRRGDGAITFTWRYDHLLSDGRNERFTLKATHTLQPVDAYEAEIAAAGLQINACYGDFDYSPYEPDSPYLILLTALS